MPLTDEQLNAYEQGLRQDADNAQQDKLDELGNAYPDYGAQSMTNTVNKYNYEKQKEYYNALAQREQLAQTWQQTANQRALTQAQVKNMADESSRGQANIALQKSQQEQQQQQHKENLAQATLAQQQQHEIAQEQLGLQKAQYAHQVKQDKLMQLINLRQHNYNMMLGAKQMSDTDWINKTNAQMKNMGLQIDLEKLRALSPANLPTQDTSREDSLKFLASILKSTDQSAIDLQRVAGQQGAEANIKAVELQIAQLNAAQQSFLFNSIGSVGLPLITGAFN
jgi:hypothetical protein